MVLPTAIVILGSIITSTLLTLFVVPSLYLRFDHLPNARKNPRARKLDEVPTPLKIGTAACSVFVNAFIKVASVSSKLAKHVVPSAILYKSAPYVN